MADVAISAEGVWKEYAIGARQRSHETFREMLARRLGAPFLRPEPGESEEHIWALRDVGFNIRAGEVTGIIGRNGAGKSTLLKVLSRITEPTRGRISIRGRVSSLLEVGTGFHPELTGRENVFLNGAILGMTRSDLLARFDEIVAFAEVERFVDTQVKHYSSGMQMRLAFAVAAHLDPEILIVDEVLAVGDAAFQKKCLGKMQSFSGGGRTVLFVSHHMELVRGLCQRTLLMEAGQIAFEGNTREAVGRYLDTVGGESPVEVDSRLLPRPPGVAPTSARIVRVRFVGGRGGSTIFSGDSVGVEFDLEVTRPISEIVTGWAVAKDGLPVFETRSVDSFPPIQELRPGLHTFRSVVKAVPLAAGDYAISIGLRNASQTLDYLPEVLGMAVDSGSQVSSTWFDQKRGVISVRGEWDAPVLKA